MTPEQKDTLLRLLARQRSIGEAMARLPTGAESEDDFFLYAAEADRLGNEIESVFREASGDPAAFDAEMKELREEMEKEETK